MSKKTALYVLLSLAAGCTSVSAQNAKDIFNLFGGLMQSAIMQATQAEWQKLPQSEIACVDQILRQRGSDLATVIRQGMTPSDPRIGDVRSGCRPSVAQDNSSDNQTYYVANAEPPDAFLSLRTDPSSTFGEGIMTMPNGTRLQVLQRQDDGWWYVKVVPTGEEGWALSGQGDKVWIECCAAATATQSPDQPQPGAENQSTQTQQPLWDHNGSIVYLVAQGRFRKFYYKEPRSGMVSAGAKPGSLLFDGEVIGDQYQGTAYIFNGRCGPQPYHVSGPILDNYRRVELRGDAPRVDDSCQITEYVDDKLEFQLIEPSAPAVQPAGQSARKVAPNFDCDKAKTAREITICGSDELSELDHQYGVYWAQAEPLDKDGTAKNEIVKQYHLGEACNASVDCIRNNIISGIDYLALFLKGDGVQVASYAEIQAAKQKEVEQQKEADKAAKAEEEQRRIQREDDERRLAIVTAEAARAQADADKAKALAELEAAKAKIAAQWHFGVYLNEFWDYLKEVAIYFKNPEVYLAALAACGLGVVFFGFWKLRVLLPRLKIKWSYIAGILPPSEEGRTVAVVAAILLIMAIIFVWFGGNEVNLIAVTAVFFAIFLLFVVSFFVHTERWAAINMRVSRPIVDPTTLKTALGQASEEISYVHKIFQSASEKLMRKVNSSVTQSATKNENREDAILNDAVSPNKYKTPGGTTKRRKGRAARADAADPDLSIKGEIPKDNKFERKSTQGQSQTRKVSSDTHAMMMFEANKKSMLLAYLLWFFLGGAGAHRFYAGKIGSGVLQLCTAIVGFGLLFVFVGVFVLLPLLIWVLVDAFLIPGWIRNQNSLLAVHYGALYGS